MKRILWILFCSFVFVGFALRTYKVTTIPPGLYIDEVSIGINAYDILTTGKDQFGVPHPLTFAAFGEYKMPVYIYLVSGAMYFFGKTEFAIRFPSILFGSMTIGVLFLLFTKALEIEIKKEKIVLSLSSLGAILLATSTWHLQFSRAGFEAVVALFFYTCALLFFVYFWKNKHIFYFVFADVFLFLTFYTYDGYRLIIPITILITLLFFGKEKKQRRGLITSSIVLFFILMPLVLFTFTQSGLMRLSQTSAFAQFHFANWLQQVLADIVTFLKNYLSFFSLTFLFRFGDQINRHQVSNFGLLYIWQLPYVVLGLLSLPKIKTKIILYGVVFLLIIAPMAASLTVPSPHSLRFLMAVLPFTFLTVLGCREVGQRLQKKKLLRTLVFLGTFLIAIVQVGYYLDYYYIHYPKTAQMDWGGSCKEVAQNLASVRNQYSAIYIDSNLMCVSEYFLFYTPQIAVRYVGFNQVTKLKNDQQILFIKPKNKEIPPGQLIDNIYLQNLNHDVFAQFWKL